MPELEDMTFIITTHDSSSHILKQSAWLMDKYIPEISGINVLGYSVFPELPERFNIVRMKDRQIKVSDWAMDIYHIVKNIESEFILWSIEDFLITKPIDYEVMMGTFNIMVRDASIGRYELGIGHKWHKGVKILHDFGDWQVYEYGQESLYKISTQISIWRKESLLHYLNNLWTPWEFEVEGSKEADKLGFRVIATKGRIAFGYDAGSALSSKRFPGKVNVKSIEKPVIEEMISIGLLERENLIYAVLDNDWDAEEQHIKYE